jgi:ComF family protein
MNYLFGIWDDFISLLFPRVCYGCGCQLLRNEKLICTECYVLIPRTDFHLHADNPVARLFWGRCSLEKAAAFSFYNRGSRIRNLIHSLKYKGIKDLGPELGRMYGQTLKNSGFTSDIDLLVPVPLHPSKIKTRGFNQSELISEGLADATGLEVDRKCLRRLKGSATQTRKSRFERWTNVEGIFSVAEADCLKGKHILLVDDVITTGSTIESCANELLKIEGLKVSAIALAYTVT